MPYLSHNYRFESKPRVKSLIEAVVFFVLSTAAIFITLLVLGWFSA